MIGQTLVLACATFALVAGSCFEMPKQIIQANEGCVSAPIVSDNSFSCGPSFSAPVMSTPSFSADCGFGGAVVSAPAVSDNVFSGASLSLPAVSDNSFSGIFSAGAGSFSGAGATNGPETSVLPVIQAPSVALPAQEGPLVSLSSPSIPAPRVIAQKCICTKTIVKPQVYQRTVTVPKIQRYLKRTVTPVVENFSYKSTPVSQGSGSATILSGSGISGAVFGSGASFGSAPVVLSSGSGASFGSAPVVLSSGSGSFASQSACLPALPALPAIQSSPVVLNAEPCAPSCPRFF